MITALRSLPAEFWAATAAFITGAVLIVKKVLTRKDRPKPDYITRIEFHQSMTAVRDRIGASYLAMADKLDANHKEIMSALDRQGAVFERRLDQLETNFARVDERTKVSSSSSSSFS